MSHMRRNYVNNDRTNNISNEEYKIHMTCSLEIISLIHGIIINLQKYFLLFLLFQYNHGLFSCRLIFLKFYYYHHHISIIQQSIASLIIHKNSCESIFFPSHILTSICYGIEIFI